MSKMIQTMKAKEIKGKVAISCYSHTKNSLEYFVAVCIELTGENKFFGTSSDAAFAELEKSI